LEFFQYGWPIAMALIGFLAKWMADRVQKDLDEHKKVSNELQKEVSQVKLDYVHKTEMSAIRNEIMARFDRWEDKLEQLRK
jgi:hypothetical protein